MVSLAPDESSKHFGWLGALVGRDVPASSVQTREKLGWDANGPGLISDLENMRYLPSVKIKKDQREKSFQSKG